MFEGTTIVAVKREGVCAIAGDGQVTMGQNTVMKNTAQKLRRLYKDRVVIGFAGSVADAFTLSERFENKLEQFSGNLRRAAVELLAADKDDLLLISGNGEVIDPDDGVAAIGSGGNFALAAARALRQNTELSASEIARKSIEIAADICIFTNRNITVKEV